MIFFLYIPKHVINLMDKNVEDILGGEDPKRGLSGKPAGPTKKLATAILESFGQVKSVSLSRSEKEALWKRIEASTQPSKSERLVRWIGGSVAACALAVLAISLWVGKSDDDQPAIAIAAQNIHNLPLDTGDIKLNTPGNRTLTLTDDDVVHISALARTNGDSGKDSAFSTLTVPYGKRTEVVFPDGSKVWLNAGSQLTFPEVFDEDQRTVYLTGEGYFDIKHDARRPFYVYTADMLVTVLGTAFNVSSYRDDPFTAAVLLNGKIALKGLGDGNFEDRILEPGSRAVWQREDRTLQVKQEDTDEYVSWTRKQLVLKSTTLAELRVRLERIYNTQITGENDVLTGETFSGVLDLTQPLANLLNTLYDPLKYNIQQEERRIIIRRR